MPMWAIWLGLVVVVLIGGVAAWVLVSTFGSGNTQDKIRLEAIKLAGTIAVGTGGVAALLLTARRQHTTELDLVQKGHDADERRVTELYTAAAQQLASDKAPFLSRRRQQRGRLRSHQKLAWGTSTSKASGLHNDSLPTVVNNARTKLLTAAECDSFVQVRAL